MFILKVRGGNNPIEAAAVAKEVYRRLKHPKLQKTVDWDCRFEQRTSANN